LKIKLVGRGKTYPHREWFRNAGFDWNLAVRQWEKHSDDVTELERLRIYAADKFEILCENEYSAARISEPVNTERHVDTTQIKLSQELTQSNSEQPTGRLKVDGTRSIVPPAQSKECTVCGRIIPPARLAAVPDTEFCVDHADQWGRNPKRFIAEPLGTRDDWKRDRASWKKTNT
jgi:RNA polymerase-binding transcription factor DksA